MSCSADVLMWMPRFGTQNAQLTSAPVSIRMVVPTAQMDDVIIWVTGLGKAAA